MEEEEKKVGGGGKSLLYEIKEISNFDGGAMKVNKKGERKKMLGFYKGSDRGIFGPDLIRSRIDRLGGGGDAEWRRASFLNFDPRCREINGNK